MKSTVGICLKKNSTKQNITEKGRKYLTEITNKLTHDD